MELLEERIRQEGKIRPGGILKVDNFLNHQIDSTLLFEIAKEFKRLFEGEGINKVLTIEASGIAIEKAFQGGGDQLRAQGLRIESLAKVASMDDEGHISFC